jgi:ParB-like chromosome segregation protein Spo0J
MIVVTAEEERPGAITSGPGVAAGGRDRRRGCRTRFPAEANNRRRWAAQVVHVERVQCVRDGCPRQILICPDCHWGVIVCSWECMAARRAAQQAAYWRSPKGKATTARRVARRRAKNVTDRSAQILDPSTIVTSRDTAPPVVERGAAVPSEEQIDEEDRSSGPAGNEVCGSAQLAEDAQRGDRAPVAPDVVDRAAVERLCAESAVLCCARCGRAGVERSDGGGEVGSTPRVRRAWRTRSTSCPMTSTAEAAKPHPIGTIGTTLGSARCRQPARIERMKQSLARHGQMTPLVTTARAEGVELVDGFKRLAAAEALGWPSVSIVVRPLDAMGQWAAMLLLNVGPVSMTTLEEALVLREMVKTGLMQTEVAELCARHKTWVSRRIGLVDRLHPELVEAMKLGLLHPGSARRLLSLPPGNQLEVSAAAQSAGLGPRDTELLVGLWCRTKDPKARRTLLSEPRASLRRHHPETRRSPLDPRLSPEGQRLCRSLHRLEAASTETSRRLCSAISAADRRVLSEALHRAAETASRLATELGSARTSADADESGGDSATS